jgi:subtilisin family serine protease
MDDENGHGTHVAGTIGALDNSIGSLGVAPNTTVISVRVLDRRGSGSTSGVIAGVDFVGANGGAGDCANTISGTSMASPHACAVIMMTNGNPGTSGTAGNDPDGNADSIIHL